MAETSPKRKPQGSSIHQEPAEINQELKILTNKDEIIAQQPQEHNGRLKELGRRVQFLDLHSEDFHATRRRFLDAYERYRRETGGLMGNGEGNDVA